MVQFPPETGPQCGTMQFVLTCLIPTSNSGWTDYILEKGIDTTQTSNTGWMACCLGRCIFLDLPGYARSVNITWKKLTVQTAFRQDELKKERALVIAVPTEAPDSPGDKDCKELLQNCFSFFAKHLYICCSSSTFFFF